MLFTNVFVKPDLWLGERAEVAVFGQPAKAVGIAVTKRILSNSNSDMPSEEAKAKTEVGMAGFKTFLLSGGTRTLGFCAARRRLAGAPS